ASALVEAPSRQPPLHERRPTGITPPAQHPPDLVPFAGLDALLLRLDVQRPAPHVRVRSGDERRVDVARYGLTGAVVAHAARLDRGVVELGGEELHAAAI